MGERTAAEIQRALYSNLGYLPIHEAGQGPSRGVIPNENSGFAYLGQECEGHVSWKPGEHNRGCSGVPPLIGFTGWAMNAWP